MYIVAIMARCLDDSFFALCLFKIKIRIDFMEIFVLENRNSNLTHTQLGWVKILQYRWLGYSNS